MKKIYISLLLICIVLICIGCKKSNDENYVLSSKEKSSLVRICQYTELPYYPVVTPISEDDIRQAVNLKLNSVSELEEIISRSNVIEGDSIYVDYIVTQHGKVIKVCNDVKFTVGEGTFDADFENNLLSAEKGIPVIFDYIVTDSDDNLFNQTVGIEAIVTKIYRGKNPILSDEYISSHFEVDTVEEFTKMVVTTLEKTRDEEDRIRNAYSLLKTVCDGSDFIINKDEMGYLRDSIKENYQQIAYLYDMELSEYIYNVLNMDEGSFDHFCTDEAVLQIEMNLVIAEISRIENMSVNDAEFQEYANSKGYTELDLLISSNLKKELGTDLMRNKVYDYLLSQAKKINDTLDS